MSHINLLVIGVRGCQSKCAYIEVTMDGIIRRTKVTSSNEVSELTYNHVLSFRKSPKFLISVCEPTEALLSREVNLDEIIEEPGVVCPTGVEYREKWIPLDRNGSIRVGLQVTVLSTNKLPNYEEQHTIKTNTIQTKDLTFTTNNSNSTHPNNSPKFELTKPIDLLSPSPMRSRILEEPGDYVELGNQYKEEGLYEDAILAYKKSIGIENESCESYNDKGVALIMMGCFEESIQYFDLALMQNKDYLMALHNKGRVLVNLGRLEEALECYKIASKNHPNDLELKSSISDLYKLMGRHSEAQEILIMTYQDHPNFQINNKHSPRLSPRRSPQSLRPFN